MQIITKASSKLDSFPVLEQEKVVWQTNFRPIQKSMGGEPSVLKFGRKIVAESKALFSIYFGLEDKTTKKNLGLQLAITK